MEVKETRMELAKANSSLATMVRHIEMRALPAGPAPAPAIAAPPREPKPFAPPAAPRQIEQPAEPAEFKARRQR